MTPTPKLRFVERKVQMHPFYRTVGPDGQIREEVLQTYRVLQQWWEWGKELDWPGEWRDVPLEVEK